MGSLKKTKILKKKNSISNEKYPIAVSWGVEQRTDIYGKTYNGGVFGCFLFGEDKAFTIYAHDKDVKTIDVLIKELTDFRNVILKGK